MNMFTIMSGINVELSLSLSLTLFLTSFPSSLSGCLNFIKKYTHNLQGSVQNENVGPLVHKAGKIYH